MRIEVQCAAPPGNHLQLPFDSVHASGTCGSERERLERSLRGCLGLPGWAGSRSGGRAARRPPGR
eukprot:15468319-Alexandrium_andersonii.AAC.1